MLNARRPHFLKVFLPNLSSEKLEVPSKFIKHLGGRTSGAVTLTGPSGNSWHADLIENNVHLFFHDGWLTFARDHSLECGDSLVFRYDGNLHFTVQIFDQNSCEKDEAFHAKCSKKPTDQDNGNSGKKRDRGTETSFSTIIPENKMRGNWTPVLLDFPAVKRERSLAECMNEGREFEGVEKFFTECDKPVVVLAMPSSGNGQVVPAVVNSCVKRNATELKKSWMKKQKTGIEEKTSISKFIETKVAHYFTSNFPYFVRVMKYSHVNSSGSLKIPAKFSMAHLPKFRINVTLRNLNGECWTLTSIPSTRYSTLCGRWLAFVRGNGIKIEDVCIFELVGEFEMRVRVLRLGLEGLETRTQNESIDVSRVGLGGLPFKTPENVPHDTNGFRPPENSEQTSEPSMNGNEEDKMHRENVLGIQQEASSSIDTSDDTSALKSDECYLPSPISRTSYESKDELPVFNAEGTISFQTSGKSLANLHTRRTTRMQPKAEKAELDSFISPFPCFMKVMKRSNVGGIWSLNVPRTFAAAHFPNYSTKIIVRNLQGECWDVTLGRYGLQTTLFGGWMFFARENDLEIGDTCVFELVDERVFQVRVFGAGNSRREQECPSNDAVLDDSSASFKLKKPRRAMRMQPKAEKAELDSFISPFPCFMKVMKRSSVGGLWSLMVPISFAAAHFPNYSTKIILRNLQGECWDVTLGCYGPQATLFGGWKLFARENDLEIGDACVFELVDERVFQVRIFGAGNSHREPERPRDDAILDDSRASFESTPCSVLLET